MNKSGINTTLLNASKQARLSSEHVLPRHITSHPATSAFLAGLLKLGAQKEAILYWLGVHLLGKVTNEHALRLLGEYSYPKVTFDGGVPQEFDLLGAAYQYLNTKSENLAYGSFYTSYGLAREMVQDYRFDAGETLLDPACGSGVFLLASDAPPEQLFGVDFDPVAVMIAKFNFFIKFPNSPIYPKIVHADFLDWYAQHRTARYTYVVGNPPYGASLDLAKAPSRHITSGESFSYFVEYGFELLEQQGTLSYLVPEALLNVKRHADVRNFLLDSTHIYLIQRYDARFAGVMSGIYRIDVKHGAGDTHFITPAGSSLVQAQSFRGLKNHIFASLTQADEAILRRVRQRTFTTLTGSTFGLGIVTGDNRGKLLPAASASTEPIFTGKEVGKYSFLPVKKHIVFDRSQLQQVAPDSIYRAPAKLVYKTISKQIKVALDLTGSLTTASANIVIPAAAGNSIYSILLLLNSDLYSFLNQKLHGGVNKISRENLESLPLPKFSPQRLAEIEQLVNRRIEGAATEADTQRWVYDFFEITAQERAYITVELARR